MNFINPKTKKEFLFSNFQIKGKLGKIVYIDSITKEELKDSDGTILEPIRNKEIGAPMIMKSNNKEHLQSMLKKRSSEHYKKEIAEVKHEKMKSLSNNKDF